MDVRMRKETVKDGGVTHAVSAAGISGNARQATRLSRAFINALMKGWKGGWREKRLPRTQGRAARGFKRSPS